MANRGQRQVPRERQPSFPEKISVLSFPRQLKNKSAVSTRDRQANYPLSSGRPYNQGAGFTSSIRDVPPPRPRDRPIAINPTIDCYGMIRRPKCSHGRERKETRLFEDRGPGSGGSHGQTVRPSARLLPDLLDSRQRPTANYNSRRDSEYYMNTPMAKFYSSDVFSSPSPPASPAPTHPNARVLPSEVSAPAYNAFVQERRERNRRLGIADHGDYVASGAVLDVDVRPLAEAKAYSRQRRSAEALESSRESILTRKYRYKQ